MHPNSENCYWKRKCCSSKKFLLTSAAHASIILLVRSSIAQLVEHAAVNRRVVGSSPTWGAIRAFSSVG